MDKFMVKAMDDVKQKFTDLKVEDPLGKALTEVKSQRKNPLKRLRPRSPLNLPNP